MDPDEHSPRPTRPATLADVAKRAGVSKALASIVMRDAAGASPASRRRVLAVADELGYRPDARARSLASLQPRVMGVLFGQSGRFQLELIDGLYAAAEEPGWDVVLSALTTSRDETRAIESLRDFRFQALVMLGPPVPEPILAGQLPLVVVGWHVDHPDVDVVRTSDEHGMALAVQHLVDLGHQRIAHLQGGTGVIAISRRNGYIDAMRQAGIENEIHVVVCAGEDQLDGQHGARALLDDTRRLPTAVVAFNDDIAAAAMAVLTHHGVGVPGDVSIVGFDDSALARSPELDLTSVRQLPHELARLAVQRIVSRTQGSSVTNRDIVLLPELVVRSSTGHARHP